MQKTLGLQSSIWSNRFKTGLLVVMFPSFLFLVAWGFTIREGRGGRPLGSALFFRETLSYAAEIMLAVSPVIIVRFFISFSFHRQLIFTFAGAKPISRKDYPKLYNIVENLCISRGLKTPKIGILEDDSMNAFATGRNQHNARIVFSRGIIQRLNKREIEAVAGHELTHIINKDVLLMVCVVVFIGIFTTIGQILIRVRLGSSEDSGKAKMATMVAGFAFLLIGWLIFPFIRLAVSRKREFLADAGSVELTKNPEAMISALSKISSDSRIESIKKDTVAAMCIDTPFTKQSSRWSDLRSTHPSMGKRIEALKGY